MTGKWQGITEIVIPAKAFPAQWVDSLCRANQVEVVRKNRPIAHARLASVAGPLGLIASSLSIIPVEPREN
jgi:hypothetical protein